MVEAFLTNDLLANFCFNILKRIGATWIIWVICEFHNSIHNSHPTYTIIFAEHKSQAFCSMDISHITIVGGPYVPTTGACRATSWPAPLRCSLSHLFSPWRPGALGRWRGNHEKPRDTVVFSVFLPCCTSSVPHLRRWRKFQNRKPIEVGCCESWMAERSHWWIYLYIHLSIYLSIYLSTLVS